MRSWKLITIVSTLAVIATYALIVFRQFRRSITPAVVQSWVDAFPASSSRDEIQHALEQKGFEFNRTLPDRLDGTLRNFEPDFLFSDDIDVHFNFGEDGRISRRIIVPMSRGM